jgi:hypothetical protein
MAADRAYRRMPRSPRALKQLEVATRIIQQLAVKLRITPCGRTDSRMVARSLRKVQPSAYEQMNGAARD